ncbi:unnamed protein product, partial [Gulo gulo]
MAGKGEEQGAGVKSHPGGGKALLARKYSGRSVNKQKWRRSLVLLAGWRPEAEGTPSVELGQVMGPQREQYLPQAPCMADGIQLAPLGAPAQGLLDVRSGESPPGQRASPGG